MSVAFPVRHLAFAAAASLLASSLSAQPIGTAFTYQGRLTDGGNPASGNYDLQFVLMDAVVGGSQVGPILTRDDVTVTNGLFVVSLDFGVVFAGNKRFLELGVRPGASSGAYTSLPPRQELAPAPNAVFSASAPWIGISGKPAGFADDIDNDSGGDITGVTAGTGLAGGGATGSVTLGVDTAVTQARVSGACPAGQSIRTVNENGTVVCETDDDTPAWGLSGNAGTNPAANFMGTTDNTPFELRVNNQRALRLERLTTVGPFNTYTSQNVLGGDSANAITAGVTGATIAGGGGLIHPSFARPNRVTDVGGTVGGGFNNQAGDGGTNLTDHIFTTVAGGDSNSATSQWATVGGGLNNLASSPSAVVAGGRSNRATGFSAAIAGGQSNLASGQMSVVGGGESNRATAFNSMVVGGVGSTASGDYSAVIAGWGTLAGGAYSLAAGRRAVVRDAAQSGDADGDQGTFVWADDPGNGDEPFVSTGPRQFLIRAAGGVGINTNAPPPFGLSLADPGKLTFGLAARQVIDLNSPAYGIGVQGGVVYFRTEPPGGNFTWFMGGSHSNTQNDPGPGGVRNMRLDGAGNLFVRGALSPGGADFAEMLPAEPGLEAGDVLAIGPDGQLTRTTSRYQRSIAGVYSTKPGVVGGAADGDSTDGKVPLAIAGIVPVKVTDEGGPIAAGDALTSSSTPGHAMKAATVRVGDIEFFPSGLVIGKALEPLPSATGVIRALVVLQ